MNEFEVVNVEPFTIAAVRTSSRREDLSVTIPKASGPIWPFLRSKPETKPGLNIVVYLDGPKQMEVGVQVSAKPEPPTGIVYTQTPAGLAAHGVHIGPYSELGRTYDALHAWIAENKLRMKGPFWEVYGHWNDDPLKLRTDIYFLVERI